MEKIIVYFDDAAHARHQIAPMRSAQEATHWVLVACAPKLTQRIGKWVSHSARERWRSTWAAKQFDQIVPELSGTGDQVTTVLARGPLQDLTRKLMAQHGVARVLDARRPKLGQDMAPVVPGQVAETPSTWQVPGAVAGLGVALVLAAE